MQTSAAEEAATRCRLGRRQESPAARVTLVFPVGISRGRFCLKDTELECCCLGQRQGSNETLPPSTASQPCVIRARNQLINVETETQSLGAWSSNNTEVASPGQAADLQAKVRAGVPAPYPLLASHSQRGPLPAAGALRTLLLPFIVDP